MPFGIQQGAHFLGFSTGKKKDLFRPVIDNDEYGYEVVNMFDQSRDPGSLLRWIERMVRTLLGVDRPLRPADAADAVALALCHLARESMSSRVRDAMSR